MNNIEKFGYLLMAFIGGILTFQGAGLLAIIGGAGWCDADMSMNTSIQDGKLVTTLFCPAFNSYPYSTSVLSYYELSTLTMKAYLGESAGNTCVTDSQRNSQQCSNLNPGNAYGVQVGSFATVDSYTDKNVFDKITLKRPLAKYGPGPYYSQNIAFTGAWEYNGWTCQANTPVGNPAMDSVVSSCTYTYSVDIPQTNSYYGDFSCNSRTSISTGEARYTCESNAAQKTFNGTRKAGIQASFLGLETYTDASGAVFIVPDGGRVAVPIQPPGDGTAYILPIEPIPDLPEETVPDAGNTLVPVPPIGSVSPPPTDGTNIDTKVQKPIDYYKIALGLAIIIVAAVLWRVRSK